jgi:hypothetical protein
LIEQALVPEQRCGSIDLGEEERGRRKSPCGSSGAGRSVSNIDNPKTFGISICWYLTLRI